MKYIPFPYRNGNIIINSKADRLRELEEVFEELPSMHPIDGLHNLIRDNLERKGWNTEELVSKSLAKRQSFDAYRDRIALEIEFSRYEFVYRDYFRFLLAFNEGKIDVGVLIVHTEKTREFHKNPSAAPSFENCKDELPKLKSMLAVPIWVLGLQ